MRQVTLIVPAISCAHCKHTVEDTLKQFDGVHQATVDVPNKRVALTYDPAKVELSKLEEALSEEGYDVADVRS
jgi:copper chaperone CopZ